MATDKINNYAIGDNNFESVMLTLDQTFRNKHDCYSFSATALKAGSVIEINGSLYPVTHDMTLPNMSSKKYLMAVPSSAGTFTLLATSTAPTWSDSKQGFYGTSTTANYKYIAVKEGSTIYKYNDRPFYINILFVESLNMSGNITTAGDIDCNDITSDTITTPLANIDNVNSYTLNTLSYAPSTTTTQDIKKPTMLYSPTSGSVDIYDSSSATYLNIVSGVDIIAINPGKYRFTGGVTYKFIGAANTTDISEVY